MAHVNATFNRMDINSMCIPNSLKELSVCKIEDRLELIVKWISNCSEKITINRNLTAECNAQINRNAFSVRWHSPVIRIFGTICEPTAGRSGLQTFWFRLHETLLRNRTPVEWQFFSRIILLRNIFSTSLKKSNHYLCINAILFELILFGYCNVYREIYNSILTIIWMQNAPFLPNHKMCDKNLPKSNWQIICTRDKAACWIRNFGWTPINRKTRHTKARCLTTKLSVTSAPHAHTHTRRQQNSKTNFKYFWRFVCVDSFDFQNLSLSTYANRMECDRYWLRA